MRSRRASSPARPRRSLAERDDSDAQNHFSDAARALAKGARAGDRPRRAGDRSQPVAAGRRCRQKISDGSRKSFSASRGTTRSPLTANARKVANTGLLRLLFEQKRYAEWTEALRSRKRTSSSTARAPKFSMISATRSSRLKHWPEAVAGFDSIPRRIYGTQDSGRDRCVRALPRAQAQADRDDHRRLNAEAYLKAWPKIALPRAACGCSRRRNSRARNNYADALPLWQANLAKEPGNVDRGHISDILFATRPHLTMSLKNWPEAATAYRAFLDDANVNPGELVGSTGQATPLQVAGAAWPFCLQNSAPACWPRPKRGKRCFPRRPYWNSGRRRSTLESLGLIYAQGRACAAEMQMVDVISQDASSG